MSQYELSDPERDIICTALAERIDGLSRYVGWIDAHPMLPNVQVAIEQIKQSIKEARALSYFLSTGRRL